MYAILGRLSWLVTVRPSVTLLVLLIVAVVLGAGAGLREPPAGLALALRQDSAITASIRILYSLLTSILTAPPAMSVRGAYRNAWLRSNLRQVADDLDRQIEAVYQRQRQVRETAALRALLPRIPLNPTVTLAGTTTSQRG